MDDNHMQQVLVATLSDVRALAGILRCVNLKKYGQRRAAFTVSGDGLCVTVEYKQVLLSSAYVDAIVFNDYHFTPKLEEGEDEHLASQSGEINLDLMLQAMDVFGGAGLAFPLLNNEEPTGLCLTWRGTGHPLILRLQKASSNSNTLCELATYEWEPRLEFPFNDNEVLAKIIMKSTWLRDALSELSPDCHTIILICSPDAGHENREAHHVLRLKAVSDELTSTFDYPEVEEVIEMAEVNSKRPVIFSYGFSHFAKVQSALRNSSRISIRIQQEGLLSLQFEMPLLQSHATENALICNYVEFRYGALLEGFAF